MIRIFNAHNIHAKIHTKRLEKSIFSSSLPYENCCRHYCETQKQGFQYGAMAGQIAVKCVVWAYVYVTYVLSVCSTGDCSGECSGERSGERSRQHRSRAHRGLLVVSIAPGVKRVAIRFTLAPHSGQIILDILHAVIRNRVRSGQGKHGVRERFNYLLWWGPTALKIFLAIYQLCIQGLNELRAAVTYVPVVFFNGKQKPGPASTNPQRLPPSPHLLV